MTNAAAGQGRFGAAFEWLGIERAWSRTRGRPEVVIGIVDHGVQSDHPLLAPNIRRDHARRPASAESDDPSGTCAAGIAAGRESATDGFAGVAPGSRILPVQFSPNGGAQTFDLAHAIEYAAEMGACIIVVSHTADVSSASVLRAMQYAATRNALVVCSATRPPQSADIGNAAPNLLCVLDVDARGQLLPGCLEGIAHLAAPAFARVPAWQGAGSRDHTGPGLGAPHVAGCAALIKSLNPAWGYHEIKEHLLSSATVVSELAGRCQTGAVLNAAHAVLGPIELEHNTATLTWTSLDDAEIRWKLRYRSAMCANVVALYRAQGSDHWRELGHTRARELRMTIPSDALRRSSGTLRLSARDSNFYADEIELAIV
jgi:subtilisin family serine protease